MLSAQHQKLGIQPHNLSHSQVAGIANLHKGTNPVKSFLPNNHPTNQKAIRSLPGMTHLAMRNLSYAVLNTAQSAKLSLHK